MATQPLPIKAPVLAIAGPTAIGKTSLSLKIANELDCEIISVDSMQVYKYMDIGTAKIKKEEMAGIPHHLIDVAFPDEEYDAARFVFEAAEAIEKIVSRGKIPLLAGGTGLYLKALTHGLFPGIPENEEIRANLRERIKLEGSSKLHEEFSLCDPDSAKRIHPNDSSRIIRGLEIYLASGITWSEHIKKQKEKGEGGTVQNILQIGLTCPRDILYKRINLRTEIMLEEGLEEEVRGLLESGYHADLNSMKSIGYRHMVNYIQGDWNFQQMVELLSRDTRRYAKRQYTWFNGLNDLEWFDVNDSDAVLYRMHSWLQNQ